MEAEGLVVGKSCLFGHDEASAADAVAGSDTTTTTALCTTTTTAPAATSSPTRGTGVAVLSSTAAEKPSPHSLRHFPLLIDVSGTAHTR